MLVALLYLLVSIAMNITNRILFSTGFKFNFTLILLQQVVVIFCYNFIFSFSERFNKDIGQSSFSEFYHNKWIFIGMSILFILNIYSSFKGNQQVSTPMFLCLRKFLIVFNLICDLFYRKKELPRFFVYSVALITIGAVLTSVNINFNI